MRWGAINKFSKGKEDIKKKGCKSNNSLIYILLRRDRDSNPGCLAAQRFSRPPQSTTLPPLQNSF